MKKREEDEGRKAKLESEKDAAKKTAAARLSDELIAIDSLIAKGKTLGQTKVVAEVVGDLDIAGLRILSDRIRQKEKSAVIILAVKDEEKVSFIVAVTEDLVKKNISASGLAKELAGVIDGSGGGKPTFAQGGGKSPAKLEDALIKITETIRGKIV